MIKLSIIIPYYNTKEYTDELLESLDKQMLSEVEVILVDDGSSPAYKANPSYYWLRIIRTRNHGQSAARNKGLECARGDYIQFIDSDDMVPEYFINKLLEKIPEGSDLIEYSWKTLGDRKERFLIRQGGRCPNISACTRCFKRSYIGNIRFNEQKDATEDEDFARRIGIHRDPQPRVSVVEWPMYYYRKHEGSTEDRFKNGQTKTKRIIYFFKEVTADRTDILEAVKEDDKKNQVILMTYKNEMPELKTYCQVIRPFNMWAHELKGEPFNRVVLIPKQEAGSERLSEKENEVHPSESGL